MSASWHPSARRQAFTCRKTRLPLKPIVPKHRYRPRLPALKRLAPPYEPRCHKHRTQDAYQNRKLFPAQVHTPSLPAYGVGSKSEFHG